MLALQRWFLFVQSNIGILTKIVKKIGKKTGGPLF